MIYLAVALNLHWTQIAFIEYMFYPKSYEDSEKSGMIVHFNLKNKLEDLYKSWHELISFS